MVMAAFSAFSDATAPELTPEQQREEQISSAFDPWDGSHIQLKKLVKAGLHNPKAFEHVETVYWDRGDYLTVRMTYRGENAFGAIRTAWVEARCGLDGEVLEITKTSE